MRSQIVKKIATTTLFLLTATIVLGQSGGGSLGPPAPAQNRGPELPIDDNLIILLVVGLLYGAYIAYKIYRVKNTPA